MVRPLFLSKARFAIAVLLPILVAACGGGGNSRPPNVAPTVGALADQMLDVGETVDVQVSVTDGNAADTHTVSATSSDTGIAGVAVSGTRLTVTAVAAGSATITVMARDSSGAANAQSQSASFTVLVAEPNARPEIAAVPDQQLEAGGSLEIEVVVSDEDAEDTHSLAVEASDTAIVRATVTGQPVDPHRPRQGHDDRNRQCRR